MAGKAAVQHVDEIVERIGAALEVMIAPEEILDDPLTDVRPWSSADDAVEEIAKFATSIRENGQINPIEVRWVLAEGALVPEDGYYRIISGRRRKAAIMQINAEAEAGIEPMKVRATVRHGMSDMDAYRHALVENAQRKDASPLDNAQNIANVRERFEWRGGKHTRAVADFFGMSPAWVTTTEKVLKLPKETQSLVHTGQLSADDAAKIAKIAEKKGPEVAAQVAQDAVEAGHQVEEAVVDAAAETAGADGKKGKKKATKKKAAQAKTSVIKKAAEGAGVKQVKTRKEIIEFFIAFDSPEYDAVIRGFVEYFEQWAAGNGTDRTLTEKFDAMVEGLYKEKTTTTGTTPTIEEIKNSIDRAAKNIGLKKKAAAKKKAQPKPAKKAAPKPKTTNKTKPKPKKKK